MTSLRYCFQHTLLGAVVSLFVVFASSDTKSMQDKQIEGSDIEDSHSSLFIEEDAIELQSLSREASKLQSDLNLTACTDCVLMPDQSPSLAPLRNHKRNGETLWVLRGTYYLYLKDSCQYVVVPSSFVTDLASIPDRARVKYNPANYAEAALVHDWLYAIGEQRQRPRVDKIFRDGLRQTGHKDVADKIYRAVRIGGNDGYGLDDDFAFFDLTEDKVIVLERFLSSGFHSPEEDIPLYSFLTEESYRFISTQIITPEEEKPSTCS